MTLSGNLGFVPVDEILRLLTRSKQQGAVEVTGGGIRGRVFVGKGGIDLATTSNDDMLHQHLVNSGYADESSLRRITTGETTLAAVAEANQAIVDLLREMTVESLYQISSKGDEFNVMEGKSTPYASPKSFELEALLADAADREKEWAKVSDLVPDLALPIIFNRDLGERDEVTVKNDDWKVLSEIGDGSTVRDIADRLGTTEFWTARVTARLVNNDLVEMATAVDDGFAGTDYSSEPAVSEGAYAADDYQDDHSFAESSYDTDYAETTPPVADEPTADPEGGDVFAEEPATEQPASSGHEKSWWQEPDDSRESVAAQEPGTPEVVAEGLSEMPTVEAKEDVEEDTEAFLEKVFSELESDEPEAEGGHGLLRRRRMGTLRDFSSDS